MSLQFLTADRPAELLLESGLINVTFPPNTGNGITAGKADVIDRYGGAKMEGNPRIKKLLVERTVLLQRISFRSFTATTLTLGALDVEDGPRIRENDGAVEPRVCLSFPATLSAF